MLTTVIVATAVALWVVSVASGAALLLDYRYTPGAADASPETWPAGLELLRDDTRPTLVMVAHPRCPCTRASVGELARLVAARPDAFATHVVFVAPDGTDDRWHLTDLWRSAAAIPGARVTRDDGGAVAAWLGSTTSGHVVLFDRDGRLAFRGGLTASRGHAGDSAGRSALLAVLDSPGAASAASPPVFGCPLTDRDGDCDGERCRSMARAATAG